MTRRERIEDLQIIANHIEDLLSWPLFCSAETTVEEYRAETAEAARFLREIRTLARYGDHYDD